MTKKDAMKLGFTHYGHTWWRLPVFLTAPDDEGVPTVAARETWSPAWVMELALDIERSVQATCYQISDFFGAQPKGFPMTYIGRLDGKPLEDLPDVG